MRVTIELIGGIPCGWQRRPEGVMLGSQRNCVPSPEVSPPMKTRTRAFTQSAPWWRHMKRLAYPVLFAVCMALPVFLQPVCHAAEENKKEEPKKEEPKKQEEK